MNSIILDLLQFEMDIILDVLYMFLEEEIFLEDWEGYKVCY